VSPKENCEEKNVKKKWGVIKKMGSEKKQ